MSIYRPERDWPRYVPVNKILVSVYDRKMGHAYGEVTNISSSGACITADSHFEPDTTVLLRISFHDQPDAFVTQAEVVWSREAPKAAHPFAHGVRFRFNEEAQRCNLKGILESPGFRLEGPTEGEPHGSHGALDKLMVELTEDLDRFGESCRALTQPNDDPVTR